MQRIGSLLAESEQQLRTAFSDLQNKEPQLSSDQRNLLARFHHELLLDVLEAKRTALQFARNLERVSELRRDYEREQSERQKEPRH